MMRNVPILNEHATCGAIVNASCCANLILRRRSRRRILLIAVLLLGIAGTQAEARHESEVRPSIVIKRIEVTEEGVTLYFRERPTDVHFDYKMGRKKLFIPRDADLSKYRLPGRPKGAGMREAAFLYWQKVGNFCSQSCYLLEIKGQRAVFYFAGSWPSSGLIKFIDYDGEFVVDGVWPTPK